MNFEEENSPKRVRTNIETPTSSQNNILRTDAADPKPTQVENEAVDVKPPNFVEVPNETATESMPSMRSTIKTRRNAKKRLQDSIQFSKDIVKVQEEDSITRKNYLEKKISLYEKEIQLKERLVEVQEENGKILSEGLTLLYKFANKEINSSK